MNAAKSIYLIGGPMGVGKTTICKQLKKQLEHAVFLDGDWCWDADPFIVNEETKAMALDNICYLLNSFIACSAYKNIIFCWVMHEQGIIDHILSHVDMDGCEIRCISLIADEDTIINRLTKDIDQGIRDQNVILRSLARLPLYDKLDTIKIDTKGKTPEETAKEICDL